MIAAPAVSSSAATKGSDSESDSSSSGGSSSSNGEDKGGKQGREKQGSGKQGKELTHESSLVAHPQAKKPDMEKKEQVKGREVCAGREPRRDAGSESEGREVSSSSSSTPPADQTPPLEKKHYLTHFPKDSRCETCSRCKMQRTPHRRKAKDDAPEDAIEAKTFGELITADHIVLGSESDYSRHGDTAALVIQDFGTKWLGA